MGEVRFMISEAAKKVQVESHVLRYWEDELHIPIGRTEMGQRSEAIDPRVEIYTSDNETR